MWGKACHGVTFVPTPIICDCDTHSRYVKTTVAMARERETRTAAVMGRRSERQWKWDQEKGKQERKTELQNWLSQSRSSSVDEG